MSWGSWKRSDRMIDEGRSLVGALIDRYPSYSPNAMTSMINRSENQSVSRIGFHRNRLQYVTILLVRICSTLFQQKRHVEDALTKCIRSIVQYVLSGRSMTFASHCKHLQITGETVTFNLAPHREKSLSIRRRMLINFLDRPHILPIRDLHSVGTSSNRTLDPIFINLLAQLFSPSWPMMRYFFTHDRKRMTRHYRD